MLQEHFTIIVKYRRRYFLLTNIKNKEAALKNQYFGNEVAIFENEIQFSTIKSGNISKKDCL